jgi:hypothetical protein
MQQRSSHSSLWFHLLFILLPVLASGQNYFQGEIHYSREIKAKSKKVNLPMAYQTIGKGTTLLFKDGNFRHNYDGGIFEFELYNRFENKLYLKRRENDTIYWHDCSKGGSSIKNLETLVQRKKVLGILCDEIRIQYPDHIKVEYYNSDSVKINPQWFADFKRDDQYKIDAIQNSIFLRSETDFPLITIILEAIKIERKKIDMNLFKIPKDAILKENE